MQTALIVAASLGAFLFGVISAFWGMMVPEIEKRLGRAATVLLANSLGLVIGSIVAGPVIDQFGNKLTLTAGVALVALGVFGLGRAGSTNPAFAMAMLIGAGGSAIVTAANALIPEFATTDAARGQWSNIVNNFFAVGAFVTPMVLSRMVAAGSTLRQLATWLAVVSAAVCAYYIVVGFPPPRATGASVTAGAGQVLAQPLFWALAAMLFLYVGCEGSVWYWLNKYLMQNLNFTAQAAGTTVALFAIGIIAGRLISWYLLGGGRMSPLVLTLIGAIGIAVTYTGLLMVRDAGAVRFLVVLAGVSMAPLFPTTLAAAGTNFPGSLVGTAIGLVVTAGWLGYVFIPPSVGYAAALRSGMFIPAGAAVLLVIANVVALSLVRR